MRCENTKCTKYLGEEGDDNCKNVFKIETCDQKTPFIAKTEPVENVLCNVGLANFSLLALGTRFKYKEGETVWVKIGADLVAKWDAKQIATKWLGQSICSATENGEEIEVRIVG